VKVRRSADLAASPYADLYSATRCASGSPDECEPVAQLDYLLSLGVYTLMALGLVIVYASCVW